MIASLQFGRPCLKLYIRAKLHISKHSIIVPNQLTPHFEHLKRTHKPRPPLNLTNICTL